MYRQFNRQKPCQEQQWMHDTNTPHRSESHGIAERVVRPVSEGTATAMVQSGFAEERWNCGMECHCCMRNVHDKVSFKKILGFETDGPAIPFGAKLGDR